MHKYQCGDLVKIWDDNEYYLATVQKCDDKTLWVSLNEPYCDELTCPVENAIYLPKVLLSAEDYAKFVRYEIGISDLLGEHNIPENIINCDNYRYTVQDLYENIKNFIASGYDWDTYDQEWYDYFSNLNVEEVEKGIYPDVPSPYNPLYGEEYMISHFFTECTYMRDKKMADFLLEEFRIYLEDENKPAQERRYPAYLMEQYLKNYENIDAPAEFDADQWYIKCLTDLADQDNFEGLFNLGRNYYFGLQGYEQNYQKAKAYFIRAFEHAEDSVPVSDCALFLGNIALYGYCNNGTPDYETAFRYFSAASQFDSIEGLCMLSDFYTHGYGIPANEAAAIKLAEKAYQIALKDLTEDDDYYLFGMAAYRMGRFMLNKKDDPNDLFVARRKSSFNPWQFLMIHSRMSVTVNEKFKSMPQKYSYLMTCYYFLQAEYMMRKIFESFQRTNQEDEDYGKTCAYLEELKKEEDSDQYSISELFECMFTILLCYPEKKKVMISKSGENEYIFTFSLQSLFGNKNGRKMFIVMPSLWKAGMFSKFSVKVHTEEPINEALLNHSGTVEEMTEHWIHFKNGAIDTTEFIDMEILTPDEEEQ